MGTKKRAAFFGYGCNTQRHASAAVTLQIPIKQKIRRERCDRPLAHPHNKMTGGGIWRYVSAFVQSSDGVGRGEGRQQLFQPSSRQFFAPTVEANTRSIAIKKRTPCVVSSLRPIEVHVIGRCLHCWGCTMISYLCLACQASLALLHGRLPTQPVCITAYSRKYAWCQYYPLNKKQTMQRLPSLPPHHPSTLLHTCCPTPAQVVGAINRRHRYPPRGRRESRSSSRDLAPPFDESKYCKTNRRHALVGY